jgi:thioredoxin 1
MKTRIRDNWQVIAGIGLLVTVAGLSLGNGRSVCTAPAALATNSNLNTAKDGEETMSTIFHKKTAVKHANEADFAAVVLNSDVPVLVDFYADWCGPCKMIAPILEELARETTDAKIIKINVDHSPQLAARYGISSIPSLKVFRDGQVVGQHVGLASKAQLKSMLEM